MFNQYKHVNYLSFDILSNCLDQNVNGLHRQDATRAGKKASVL